MNFKYIFIAILGFFLINSLSNIHAQRRVSSVGDDNISDSTQVINRDSLKAIHRYKTDSIKSARKYLKSKRYRDSVEHAKYVKLHPQQARMDSIISARTKAMEKIAATRKAKADSITRIRKYKSSKRYADSVTLARRMKMDSIKNVQTHTRDSIAEVRKHTMDSVKMARKRVTDSIKTARSKVTDSVKLVRKRKTDSLTKIKSDKEKLAKAKEKKKQDDQKLKLEIKFKQKREAWSNKSMLKKRWSPQRRFFQNAFTHYNYYYNANKKMEEALTNMQRSKKENYDSLINLYPFDPNRDSSSMSADMDSIIRKASVGIQIHDPREKWANDLYLLLGQANYYRGRYTIASQAFKYIISADEEKLKKKHSSSYSSGGKKEEPSILETESHSKLDFLKHKSVHNESVLWLARTFTSWNKTNNSESVISLLESDPNLPRDLRGRLAAEKAFAYLAEHEEQEAIPQLRIVIEDNHLPDWLRMRASFLCGQLQQNQGDYAGAIASFETTLDFYPKIEMDFYARKNIAANSLIVGEDIAAAIKPFKKVLNDGKYTAYYDQVYFVMGKLALKTGNTDEAIKYLQKSIYTPKATKKQKALSFAAMGDAYYTKANYSESKRAYDSSSKYASGLSNKDTAGMASPQRLKGLTEIVVPATIIHEDDSLLALADLNKKEQLSAVRRYLKMLEQKRKDSVTNAENASTTSILLPESSSSDNNDLANWYFSNPSQLQQGSAEFKKKWGNRALTDNWRRASANAFTSNSSSSKNIEVTEDNNDLELADNGLPTEKSLLSKIPNSKEQKEQVENTEQKAYIQLAKAYFLYLEDYVQTLNTLDNLNQKFPLHKQKEEELYLRYQVAFRQNQLAQAQSYSEQLIKQFPKSNYASILKPKTNKSESKRTGISVEHFYEETYNLVVNHQYIEAIMHIDIAKKQFDDSVFRKRFLLTEAMAYAGMGNYNQADTITYTFIKSYPPSDSLFGWASTIKDYVAQVRKSGAPSWWVPTPPKSLVKDSVSAKANMDTTKTVINDKKVIPEPKQEPPLFYSYKPSDEHWCIVVLPELDRRIANLKKEISKFDSLNYTGQNISVVVDYFSISQNVLVIKKFDNASIAQSFLKSLVSSNVLSGYKSNEYLPLIISATNYSKLLKDKKVANYQTFYDAVYK